MDHIPPLEHEFELTLFGNGYGECVLLHMCDNDWIIVDSCVNPRTNRTAPIEYLESAGVDISKQVRMLVVSHWHDDHIRGAGEICRLCENAKLAVSHAMHQRDFFRFVNVVNQRPIYSYAGKSTDEIRQILDTMIKRKTGSGEHVYIWASADKILYSKRTESSSFNGKVVALSPSDHSVTRAYTCHAELQAKMSNMIP